MGRFYSPMYYILSIHAGVISLFAFFFLWELAVLVSGRSRVIIACMWVLFLVLFLEKTPMLGFFYQAFIDFI